jgi:hypothetical protein
MYTHGFGIDPIYTCNNLWFETTLFVAGAGITVKKISSDI